MTTPSITLDQSQTFTTPATQETPQKGSLEGRSVVPCPSKRWLTDTQIKKISIVAFVIFVSVGIPLIGGAIAFGLGAPVIVGACIGVALGTPLTMLPLLFCDWPKADYQTPKGAERIRNDLKTKDLNTLHNDYNFSDLAKYGYISEKTAKEMESIYVLQPRFFYHPDPKIMLNYLHAEAIFASARQQYGRVEVFENADTKFHKLRSQPGFLL